MKFISVTTDPKHLQAVKEMWKEYADSLDFHLSSIPADLATFPEPYVSTGGLFLVEIDDQIAGSASFKALDEHTLEIKRFYIRRAYRRKGVGRAFMKYLMEHAKTLSKSRIQLETVLPNMEAAHKLYQSIGFYEVHTFYKGEINKNVTVMQYDLD